MYQITETPDLSEKYVFISRLCAIIAQIEIHSSLSEHIYIQICESDLLDLGFRLQNNALICEYLDSQKLSKTEQSGNRGASMSSYV